MIYLNQSLLAYNTFGIAATASAIAKIEDAEDITTSLRYAETHNLPFMVLGSGSNILLTKAHYQLLFLQNAIKGIEIVQEDSENILLSIGGGEIWHEFVIGAVSKGWGGVENLSLIPGTVGAAPIQNIGAYGVELSDVFERLEAFDMKDFSIKTFEKKDCNFGYRQSIFKMPSHKGRFLITKVILKLCKKPVINAKYGDIQKILEQANITKPTPYDISKAVIQIRQSKLPDPKILGNAGSFFKNPTIGTAQFEALKRAFPNIVGYPTEGGVKVAAGWLIEAAGWKGRRVQAAGCHERQALVLVNYGKASGEDILQLSQAIQAEVFQMFSIALEAEVNAI